MSRIQRLFALLALFVVAATPGTADAARRIPIHQCDGIALRTTVRTDAGVAFQLRSAVDIRTRKISCSKALRLIRRQMTWTDTGYDDALDPRGWWATGYRDGRGGGGWVVARSGDPTAPKGAQFAVQRREGVRIWFTLWY